MDQELSRFWEQIAGRVDGPLFLRFVLQPTIAAVLGVRAGLADSRAHELPFLWRIYSHPSERPTLIRILIKDVGKVFILAMVLDVAYQWMVFRWIYPIETLLVAITLSIVPYSLVRGVVSRVATWRQIRLAPPK